MYRKRYYNNAERGRGRRGRGGRGRWGGPGGWTQGPRGGYGPWQIYEDAPTDFGPPPWAPRWGQWGEAPDVPETENASYGPPPWGMGRWMWDEADINVADRRTWLEARKARLMAWKQHLETRLTETEVELEKLKQSEAEETAE